MTDSFWQGTRVLVTGGTGFIGTSVVSSLKKAGCKEIIIPRSQDYDLTKEAAVQKLLADTRPEVVIHLAGLVGGILANKEKPAEFFYNNLTMGTFIIHYSWLHGVKKLIAAGAGCGYPEHAPVPIKETSFWDGPPQSESAPYSLAKRLLHIQAQAYYRQYGFCSVIIVPGNVYGPYDNFDLYQSHVIPALVRKFVDAVDNNSAEVEVWGTGNPSRDFVYVDDVARGMLLAAAKCNTPELINISSGVDNSIREVVDIIIDITGFKRKVVWNKDYPDGQANRCFDISKARELLGFEPRTSLKEGLQLTINWYRANAVNMVNGRLRTEVSA